MSASLDKIFICPTKAQAPQSADLARVVRRRGIDGDRYAAHAGTFTKANEDPDAGRDVTLIEAEAIDAVRAEIGLDLSAGQHRRNLVTRGLAMRQLPNNAWLTIGASVVLRVDRTCPPCGHLERLVPGSLAALKGRGGLRTTVIRDGEIRVGDAIQVRTRRELAEQLGESFMSTDTGSPRVIVRDATIADADAIAAYNLAMAWETESLRLDESTLRSGVRNVFADASRGRYFVAEVDGAVAGCLLVTREWSDWRDGDMWWIQSVYVRPEARRAGAFRAMYRHVESAARAAGVRAIRLYVERHNARAKQTYASLGMHATDYDVMQQTLD